MKLRELLTAGAATVAFTGMASANELLLVDVGGVTTTSSIDVASELAGDLVDLDLSITMNPSSGGYLASNTIVRIDLNNAVFNGNPSITTAGSCMPAWTVSDGGDEADFVEFLASGLDGCSSAAPLLIDGSVDVSNGGDFSVTGNARTEAGTPVGGGISDALDIIEWAERFTFAATASDPAVAALASDFENFLVGSSTFGTADAFTLTVGESNSVYSQASAAASLSTAAALASSSYEIEVSGGSFAGLADIDGAVPSSGVATISVATASAVTSTAQWNAATGTSAAAIIGGDYTLSGTLDLPSIYSDKALAVTGQVEIDREGVDLTFVDTLDNTFTTQLGAVNRYRISNSSDEPTGQVAIQLLNWDTTPTNTGLVVLAASIPAKGDLVFTPEDVEALVGPYRVGDFLVNVQAQSSDLEASYTQINSAGTTNFAVRR